MTALDLSLFHWMNGVATSPWLDRVMLLATNARFWQLVVVLTAVFLALRRDRPARLAALAIILSLTVSDTVASQLLKPIFDRARPCHVLEGVRLLVRCGGQNGFPSNHASNAAAIAGSLGIFFPWSLAVTVPLAVLVAWSRVYVGVHYPADVAVGLLLGGIIGLSVGWTIRRRFCGRRRPAPGLSRNSGPERQLRLELESVQRSGTTLRKRRTSSNFL